MTEDEWTPSAKLVGLPSRLLGRTAVHADRLVGQRLARIGARKWHYAVLNALREFGPVSQSDLSRRSGLYRSDLVAVIDELSRSGHVERTPDPQDGRRNVITLTTPGRRRLTRMEKLIDSIQDELLSPLNTAERSELVRLLTLLERHHSRHEVHRI